MAVSILAAITIIWQILGYIYTYRSIYAVTGVLWTRKFQPATNLHKYAILIAARNEETVIGNLIDSIRQQDYPAELIDIFVVADNCTDNTAQAARELGAYCYERQDSDHKTKGFALQYLVECIRKDYGIDAYEGYFLFDADNLLKKDFVSRMNDSFDAGEKIITSFRNTKNFDDNWISASYGLHWIRSARSEHRARSLFRLATRIQGTGFLFASEVIKNGWPYTSLTEDRAFCADAVVNGYKISYNDAAEFFDEQPVSLRIAMRQRIRWAKGHLQALAETGGKLFAHMFYTGGAANRGIAPGTSRWRRFVNNVRLRFMSFDMLTVVFPYGFAGMVKRILVLALRLMVVFTVGHEFVTSQLAPELFRYPLEFFGVQCLAAGAIHAVALLLLFVLLTIVETFIEDFFAGVYLFLFERKRIMPIKWYKKVWFCMTFPMFDYIGKISTLIALFTKVEWKPIPHNSTVNISNLNEIHKNR